MFFLIIPLALFHAPQSGRRRCGSSAPNPADERPREDLCRTYLLRRIQFEEQRRSSKFVVSARRIFEPSCRSIIQRRPMASDPESRPSRVLLGHAARDFAICRQQRSGGSVTTNFAVPAGIVAICIAKHQEARAMRAFLLGHYLHMHRSIVQAA
jgi:hypothetical protein